MMALTIADATEGLDSKGLDQLYKDINTIVVKESKKAIEDHKDLDKKLREMWSGDDCEVFINNISSLATQILERLQEYDKAIDTEFENLKANWASFQAKNVQAR